MNKGKLHHILGIFRRFGYKMFILGFVVFMLLAVFSLRQNNLNALSLREHLLEVDQKDGDVEGALRTFREYVYSHMNTDLSSGTGVQQPIQLKYTYERLVKKEKARVDNENKSVYTAAQKYCEAKYPGSFSGGPRVPCISSYVTSHGQTARTIPDSLYKFDFQSPNWTPDLAGISLALGITCLVMFILGYVLDRWLRAELDVWLLVGLSGGVALQAVWICCLELLDSTRNTSFSGFVL